MDFRILLAILFCIYGSITTHSQVLTENDISKLAKEVDTKIKGLEINDGTIGLGCWSVGRKIIYNYGVPENWDTPSDLKQSITHNLNKLGYSKIFYKNQINIQFNYFADNILIESINIKYSELFLSMNLEASISIKGHPKAKGINLSIDPPVNWEIKEGNRPNIVKMFTLDFNTYMIIIKEHITFFSKKESEELLSDNDMINEVVTEYSSLIDGYTLLDKKLDHIDSYPALKLIGRGRYKNLPEFTDNIILTNWYIIYEDMIINIFATNIDSEENKLYELLYQKITNSIVFPDQYN